MKKYYKILLACFVTTAIISCEAYLDVSPELGIDSEEVYTDYYSTRGAVDRANNLIQNYMYSVADWAGEVGVMSDECQISQVSLPPYYVYNQGSWMNSKVRELGGMTYMTVSNEFTGNDWKSEPASKAFVAIRAVNNVLENIHLLEDYPTELGYSKEELKNQLIGQCYFLRAYHYFQIIRRYGGFPIMNKVFSPEHNFDVARPTYLESTDSLVADLDKAIALLPVSWNDQNKGRATITTAKALKGMALLYAASPLMNPQLNPYGSNSKDYNLDYARKAALASLDAIESYPAGGYQLYSKDAYTENWHRKEHGFPVEAILQPPLSKSMAPNNDGRGGRGWFLPHWAGGWKNEGQPTQNAVDWFETVDGYDIDDPEAVSTGSFDPTNPYENRDPRLKMLIFVHGDDMFEGLNPPTNGAPSVLTALPDGWYKKYEDKSSKFWCGYYHKGKHRWPGCDKFNRSKGWYPTFPHIRVAQLYLDFAEAANEAYGPNGAVPGTSLTAVEAINIIRARVDMPPVLAKYAVDKETFKERIYNERAVELYHEFHRWFDLRRWKLAKELLPQGIYAADIREVDGGIVYGKKKLEKAVRVFEDKHYWYPFPTEMMNMMSEFEQNPGW